MSIAEKKITPQQRYDSKNTVRYYLKLNKKTDSSIIKKLDTVENKQGYIKSLIIKDIAENEKG